MGFIQSGGGAVQRTAQDKMRERVSVKDFGAVIDGVTDDTTAIQAALNYCETSGAVLVGVPGTSIISSTVVIKCHCDLSMMQFNMAASAGTVAVRVGPTNAASYLFDKDIGLPFVRNTSKTGAGWTGFDTSIGVDVCNVYQCRIKVPSIYNFGVGLAVGGYFVGCVYNTFTIGVLWGNKINCKVYPKNSSGWANENLFIGGRYAHDSAEGSSVAGCRHIYLTDPNVSSGGAPNQNIFLKPSVEGDQTQFHADIQGAYNRIISGRWENSVPCRVNFYAASAGETTSNLIDGGYDSSGLAYTFSGAGSSTNNQRIGAKSDNAFDFSGNGYNVVNASGSSVIYPHFQGFEATSRPALGKTNASTDWIYRIHGAGISVKSAAASYARVEMSSAGVLYLGAGNISANAYLYGGNGFVQCYGSYYAGADNTFSLGSASYRWSVVYAGTGTINTSDEREKRDIAYIDAVEKRVALALKCLIKKFRFKDAVEIKGDGARIHIGVIAQEVIAAFQAEGLDPMRYAIICYDEWEAQPEEWAPPVYDENGVETEPAKLLRHAVSAGNRYGVRYEELLAFIVSAI